MRPSVSGRQLIVRPAQAGDYARIASIFHTAIHRTARSHYTEEEVTAWSPEERSAERWQRRTSKLTVRVAELSGVVAGFVGFSFSGCIDLLFVGPDLVRQGVGRALLAEAEFCVLAMGVVRAFADVSLAAEPFFAAMGYRMVSEQEVYCGCVALRNCRMEKVLEGDPGQAGGIE